MESESIKKGDKEMKPEIIKTHIGIVGSRSFTNYEHFKDAIIPIILKYENVVFVSGGAKGADSLAKRYAIENNIEIIEFLPDWNLYGKSAGMIRNRDIVKKSDIIIAFWDGESRGTLNSIELAKKQEKPLKIISTVEV